MPSKDGAMDDNKKSTKDVVNKKQKQMMNQEEYLPEEEYDHYKDRMAERGIDISSKDKKDATTSPQPKRKKVKGDTPMQKEFKKKYGKKATALDAVKQDIMKKYGKGAIMKTKKKKKVDEAYKSGKEVARRNSDDIKKFMQMGKDAPKNEKLNKARGEGPDAYRKAKLDSGTKAGKSNLLKGMEKAKRPVGGKLGMTAVRAAGGVGAGLVAANALRNMVKQDESYVIEDAKMKRQSDEDLKKAHDKFSSMDSSPANDFMKKRIEKEMKRRKKSVSEGLNRAIKEVQKTASVKPMKPKKKRQDTGDDGTSNTEFNENVMSPVELAIAKKRGRVREGFSAWRTDIRFNEQLKK